MKILFLLGDSSSKSLDRQLFEAVRKLIGREAEPVLYDGSPIRTLGKIDGLWFIAHDEHGACPENIMSFLEKNISALEDIPAVATGIGGKDGGMNAATEIFEFLTENGGRYLADSEPLCIPLFSSRLDLKHEEKMDLFFLVDSFLKYCGMDESDSRKIGFETVVNNYFKILKQMSPERPNVLSLKDGIIVTDQAQYDLSEESDSPPQVKDLRGEIDSLSDDYELEEEEILPALREKLALDW